MGAGTDNFERSGGLRRGARRKSDGEVDPFARNKDKRGLRSGESEAFSRKPNALHADRFAGDIGDLKSLRIFLADDHGFKSDARWNDGKASVGRALVGQRGTSEKKQAVRQEACELDMAKVETARE